MAGRRDRGDRDTEQLRKLFIGGLSYETTDETLQAFYEKWGEVVDCVVMRDPYTKRSRGFGFITYSAMEMVDEALNGRPHVIDDKEVEPKRATPRDENGGDSRMSVKKIFVGGIGQDTNEQHLHDYFSKFGSIESTAIVTDKDTGKNRGFGFVVYDDYDSVDKCCQTRMHDVNGHRAEVKKAIPRGDESLAKSAKSTRPSRGGYGGGGDRSGGRNFGGGYGSGGGGGGYGGGYGGGSGGGYGGTGGGYGEAYGGYGGGGNWNQQDGGYGGGGYGNFGSGYGASYGGGAMKGAGYAAKAAGPYGGGYGSSAAGGAGGYGGGAGGYGGGAGGYGGGAGGYGGGAGGYGGAGAAAGGYGGGAAAAGGAGAYGGAAYGTGASSGYPAAGGAGGYGGAGYGGGAGY